MASAMGFGDDALRSLRALLEVFDGDNATTDGVAVEGEKEEYGKGMRHL